MRVYLPAALLCAILFSSGAFAATPAPGATHYLVVPFNEPGDNDAVLSDATDFFVHELKKDGLDAKQIEPTEHIEAVAKAGDLCERFHGDGILIGQPTFAQTRGRDFTRFVPVVGGAISASGALESVRIRTRFRLYLIDCQGHVGWKTTTTSEKTHRGNNVAAGLTQIANRAMIEAAGQLSTR